MSESGIHKRRHKHKHKQQLREKCSRGSITEECEPQLSDHNTPEKTQDQDCAVPAAKRSKLETPNGDTIADVCEASSSESGRHRHKKHKRKKCKEAGKGLDVGEGGDGQENEDGSCRNKSNTTADKEETAVRTPAVPDLDRNSGKEQEESQKSNSEVLIPKGNRGKMAAMEYLHLWEEDRTRWSFKKKVQYWLLQNMYDKHQVPKLEFKIVLRYLEGLQGNQLTRAVQRAQQILETYEEGREDSGTSKKQYKRAVKILRVLA